MRLYRLDRSVLRFKNGAAEFLKAYTTNALDRSRNAFVDLHGKVVATFDQLCLSPREVWVVVERPFVGRLLKHLEKYLALGDTHFEEEKAYLVYFDLEGDYKPCTDEWVIPQRRGQLVITRKEPASGVSPEEFTLYRVQNRLPVQGMDYDDTLLLNVGDEEFISYTKGCYLGQEIIARVHFRGKPPKKLIVRREDECAPDQLQSLTSVVRDPATGKKMGFVFVDQ